ncbi:MAG TPA: FHA domain-containing protein, partial [Myxococcota bacterium]|nr:FHA domain-containing protein [Myxococcota bacterium]
MTDIGSFKLIIEDDEGRRSVVPVELGEISIGRLEGNTIRLKERNVSRQHARLRRDNAGGVFAEDLDSYNGLWVNGDRVIGRYQLHEGDVIRIGDFQLELRGEGLGPRREETTQRTMLGDNEGTQPSFGEAHPEESTQPGHKGTLPPPRPMSSEPTQGVAADDEPHEPTALIRAGGEEEGVRRGGAALPPPHARLVCV